MAIGSVKQPGLPAVLHAAHGRGHGGASHSRPLFGNQSFQRKLDDPIAVSHNASMQDRRQDRREIGDTSGNAHILTLAAAVCLATLVALWVLTAVLWYKLPDRIPVDFDPQGAPIRLASRDSSPNWFILPAMMTGVTAFLVGFLQLVKHLVRRQPYWGIPRRKRALGIRLPDKARVRAMRPLEVVFWAIPIPMSILMMYVLWRLFAVFTRISKAPPTLRPFAVAAVLAILTVVGLAAYGALAFRSIYLAEIRRAESEAAGSKVREAPGR